MSLWMSVLSFVANWIVFQSSLYQGALELGNQKRLMNELVQNYQEEPPIPVWYWVIPPIKLRLERNRLKKIIINHVQEEVKLDDTFIFLDRATTWLYVASASVLSAIVTTYELVIQLSDSFNTWLWIGLVILMIVFGLITISYRLSDKRKKRLTKKLRQV